MQGDRARAVAFCAFDQEKGQKFEFCSVSRSEPHRSSVLYLYGCRIGASSMIKARETGNNLASKGTTPAHEASISRNLQYHIGANSESARKIFGLNSTVADGSQRYLDSVVKRQRHRKLGADLSTKEARSKRIARYCCRFTTHSCKALLLQFHFGPNKTQFTAVRKLDLKYRY